jgi:activator of HSP90 ATPase
MIELIAQEKIEDLRLQARLLEWQTKHFGAFLMAVAQSNDQAKALQKMVSRLKLPIGDEVTVDDRPIEQVIEEGALVDENTLVEQPSFEQLSAALGALGPPA